MVVDPCAIALRARLLPLVPGPSAYRHVRKDLAKCGVACAPQRPPRRSRRLLEDRLQEPHDARQVVVAVPRQRRGELDRFLDLGGGEIIVPQRLDPSDLVRPPVDPVVEHDHVMRLEVRDLPEVLLAIGVQVLHASDARDVLIVGVQHAADLRDVALLALGENCDLEHLPRLGDEPLRERAEPDAMVIPELGVRHFVEGAQVPILRLVLNVAHVNRVDQGVVHI
mmetsp:Transcript_4606/g.13874  ORF Transcript_4606/g.13874 Transcript_4606/m.13874 type:complete len:224 (+) Transcript_4606:103-774(+)